MKSPAGVSKSESNYRGTRLRNQVRSIAAIPLRRIIRVLLGVEAASFFFAATIHAGMLISGYEHHEAMTAESVIGTVLLGGFVITWLHSRSMFTIAIIVQAFALLGTLVGIFTIIIGIGPRTVPDIAYHISIVVVLAVGLELARRGRRTETM
ncbi:hypothetical protein [Haladaptatus sp. DYF46]|uniref:hypothetical protein n=1 Tax=Haladaptatus sp. DYF46 TaxID=2886041 RepID=UPI001E457A7E|nr:hypothetical protein [Haladaptatus sp. DYF46]